MKGRGFELAVLMFSLLLLVAAMAACTASNQHGPSSDRADETGDVATEVPDGIPPGDHDDNGKRGDEDIDDGAYDPIDSEIDNERAYAIAEQMSMLDTDEKVGQLVMVGIHGEELTDSDRRFLEQYHAGGVILFSHNVADPEQTAALIRDLKQAGGRNHGIPLLVGVDEEGGRVTRLPEPLVHAPSARDVGELQDPGLAYELGKAIGATLYELGWNINFAPVLDVDSNPDNPVIGDRAYAADAAVVSRIGVAVMQGLQSEQVIPVVKHFPGHGDTSTDSHLELPVVNHDEQRLYEVELLPFIEAIQQGADAVMVGHLFIPAFDENEPSTFSHSIIDGRLRQELEFDGVVVTDDLTMGAVTDHQSIGEAAVKAIAAGADLIIVAHGEDSREEAILALQSAVDRGHITQDRLDQSVERILRLKQKYALSDQPVYEPDIAAMNDRMNAVLEKLEAGRTN